MQPYQGTLLTQGSTILHHGPGLYQTSYYHVVGKKLSVQSRDGKVVATPAWWHGSMPVYIMTYALVYQGPPLIQADELVSFKQLTLRSKAGHSLPAQSNLCE